MNCHANFARLTPFGAREDWTGGVTRHFVALAVPEEVVPEGRRAALRPQRHSHLREDGRAAVVHVRHVRQPRRDAVAGAEALERVLFFTLITEISFHSTKLIVNTIEKYCVLCIIHYWEY